MSKTNASYDLEWLECVGLAAGSSGTATSTAAASLTNTGAAWTVNQWAGSAVVAANRYANVISNTATVLTLDRWYDPATPGGVAGSTPGGTSAYVVLPGALPSQFMGITANSAAVGTGDTSLPGELTTVGGGLIRKQATLAHTAGASTGTIAATFTANGTDVLPVTVAKMGIGPSLLSTVNNLLQTLLNATATLTISGDQVSITDTITL